MKNDPHPTCTGNYWDGCRCPDCRAWNTAKAHARRERRRTETQNPTDWISAAPTRNAIHQMRTAGLTWHQIALIKVAPGDCRLQAAEEWRSLPSEYRGLHWCW